ncbi:MAG: hypothetical protein LBR80_17645 [Deltaproteobacteria bacterium]|nr:hypothetical protein [Deltaproteobacteria bacterium]
MRVAVVLATGVIVIMTVITGEAVRGVIMAAVTAVDAGASRCRLAGPVAALALMIVAEHGMAAVIKVRAACAKG